MQAPTTFQHWHNPESQRLGSDHIEFLRILKKPTWITLDGIDSSRRRAIVTLLHGNEPSGLKAIHRYLLGAEQPATNLGIFIVSVEAALHAPLLSHRNLPGEKDFNRCFSTMDPTNQRTTDQEALADDILATLKQYSPEAIIDTHNTSAHSNPFAVAVSDDANVQQLSQMFTRRLVVLNLSLGALIEQNMDCPVVTVEFGGLMDPLADQLARDALAAFIQSNELFQSQVEEMQILSHPLRLEIDKVTNLHYSASVQGEADITIFNTIDQMNFSRLEVGTVFGWLGPDGIRPLSVLDKHKQDISARLFKDHEGFLINIVPMTIFMATTDAYIASNDCLLYLSPENI
ncbi:MAG: succinylglutamate desuccinylase/aspartoacylase family protein [bacterium]|nr:hypothetical protein [Gammaproteobacteria bacterium]HIL98063.1 hypothetical protein [Pseudomonadales bacterium]